MLFIFFFFVLFYHKNIFGNENKFRCHHYQMNPYEMFTHNNRDLNPKYYYCSSQIEGKEFPDVWVKGGGTFTCSNKKSTCHYINFSTEKYCCCKGDFCNINGLIFKEGQYV